MNSKEDRLAKLRSVGNWLRRLKWWIAAIIAVLVYLATSGGIPWGERIASAIGFAVVGKVFYTSMTWTYEWANKTQRDWAKWIYLPTIVFSIPITGLLWYYVSWTTEDPVGWPTKLLVSLLGVSFCLTATSTFMATTYYRRGVSFTGQQSAPPSPFWQLLVVMFAVPGIMILWLAIKALVNVT